MKKLRTQRPLKKDWKTPQLTIHGTIEKVTQAQQVFGFGHGFTFQGNDICQPDLNRS